MNKTIRIVAISDTHGQHRKMKIPDGDILVVDGDWTYGEQMCNLNSFFAGLPHKHKILIAGNHDLAQFSHFRKNDRGFFKSQC